MLLRHITLLTGHCATHRLDTLSAEAVAACRALLPSGGPVPGFPAFRVEIQAPIFTIFRGREPLLTCALGQTNPGLWKLLCDTQSRFAPASPPEPAGQWLAVVLLPGLANTAQADISWLGDFERCMAAALLS